MILQLENTFIYRMCLKIKMGDDLDRLQLFFLCLFNLSFPEARDFLRRIIMSYIHCSLQ